MLVWALIINVSCPVRRYFRIVLIDCCSLNPTECRTAEISALLVLRHENFRTSPQAITGRLISVISTAAHQFRKGKTAKLDFQERG